MSEAKPKSFWKRPEGATGLVVLAGLIIGGGILVSSFVGVIATFLSTTVGLAISLLALGVLIFMVLDSKARTLVSYMYKSVMRWITGIFIQLDPIGILKNYINDLKNNLRKMIKQITQLRGQMHKLKEQILNNQKEIKSNLKEASKAKDTEQRNVMILKSRKAGRLKESNMRLEDLYKKMEVLYRVLSRMYENSEIMLEDISDQVEVKEQERKAMHASHGAMKSAMNIISGNTDQRYMFDQALEAIADDVSQKVGEMEQFMDLSEGFMNSIDLRNGVFEEEGLKMLEKWEKKGTSLLLEGAKDDLLSQANNDSDVLDLSAPVKKPQAAQSRRNQYDSFFE